MADQKSEEWVFLNGKMTPREEAHLSIYDHGFLYGDGAFEGIRVYEDNVFRLEQHIERLYRSVLSMGFELPIEQDHFRQAVVDTARANKLTHGYIRVSVSRGVGLGLDPSQIGKPATIVISTSQLRLYPEEMYLNGLTVVTASTRVPPSVCIDPQVKSLGKYINSINAKLEANRVGAGEALMLNMAGNVAEATGDNLFLIRCGTLSTPPASEGALPGITRATVMEIAAELNLPCTERVTTLYDVYTADEAFLTGTAAEVIPMVVCDGRRIGEGRPGGITATVTAAFRKRTTIEGVRV